MCIFFGEGDLQMNGLMIKAIAGFLFFFPPLPGSTAEQDGMWEGEGWLGTERLKSTKPFWLLQNISGKPDSTGCGRSCLQAGAPASDVTPRQAFPSNFSLFGNETKSKRGVCQRRALSSYSPRLLREGCLRWERLERSQGTEKQTEKWKSRSLSPPEAVTPPSFLVCGVFGSCCCGTVKRVFVRSPPCRCLLIPLEVFQPLVQLPLSPHCSNKKRRKI